MVIEYLQCPDCRKVILWSAAVLAQLDVGHRSQFPFPAILTYQYMCEKRVVGICCVTGNWAIGLKKVSHLAYFLVGLQDQVNPPLPPTARSRRSCACGTRWTPSTRGPQCSPEDSTQAPKGRFKASFIPGAECTKRCLLGSNSGPAQRPDCNRYMEAVISLLCDSFLSHVVVSGTRVLRWTLILRVYSRIQTLVMDHPSISSSTSLQLLAINQATLTNWYNWRSKSRETTVLQQGLACLTPSMTAPHHLPPARLKPTALPSGDAEENPFTLPVNTAGMAKQRKRASNKPAARRATPITIALGAPPSRWAGLVSPFYFLLPKAPQPQPHFPPLLPPPPPASSRTPLFRSSSPPTTLTPLPFLPAHFFIGESAFS